MKSPPIREQQRLKLITEAVLYCQKVRDMKMPVSCFTKALRDPIYFLWELRDGNAKDKYARYRSAAAVGLRRGTGDLIYDHAIPFRYLQDELLALLGPTPESVHTVLDKYGVIVLVTKEEHARLSHEMPQGYKDPLARYAKAEIVLVDDV